MARRDLQSTAAWIGVACLCACGWWLSESSAAPAKSAPPDAQYQQNLATCIENARAYLLSQASSQATGRASLVAMALLKGGTPKENPEVQQLLSLISARFQGGRFQSSSDHIYDAGVTLMALASADRIQYKPEIQI